MPLNFHLTVNCLFLSILILLQYFIHTDKKLRNLFDYVYNHIIFVLKENLFFQASDFSLVSDWPTLVEVQHAQEHLHINQVRNLMNKISL